MKAHRQDCLACGSTTVEPFCSAEDRVLPRPGRSWQILRCPACGFGWTHPPLPRERIPEYYPPSYLGNTRATVEEYLSGSLQRSRSWRSETEKATLLRGYITEGRILDVGCGDGKFLWALDDGRWDRSGIDASRETLDLVRSRVPGLRLLHGDLFAQELDGEAFDAITFWHTLEHMPDPPAVLRRTAELMRPGGWLLISLPNLDSLQAATFRSHWYPFGDVPRHLYHFSPRSLSLLLEKAGLTVHDRIFFSRRVNFHSLKHSLVHWSESRFRNRRAYYALKPLLYGIVLLEQLTGRYGIMTMVARRGPGQAGPQP